MTLRSLIMLVVGTVACSTPGADTSSALSSPPGRLLPLDSSRFHVDATFVFELPDSGGFVINGQHVVQSSVAEHLAALFASRGTAQRAVIVWDNPLRRGDAQWIARAARGAGGDAFDAELSGWPKALPQIP